MNASTSYEALLYNGYTKSIRYFEEKNNPYQQIIAPLEGVADLKKSQANARDLCQWAARDASTGVIGDPLCASAEPGKTLGKAVAEEAVQVRKRWHFRENQRDEENSPIPFLSFKYTGNMPKIHRPKGRCAFLLFCV